MLYCDSAANARLQYRQIDVTLTKRLFIEKKQNLGFFKGYLYWFLKNLFEFVGSTKP